MTYGSDVVLTGRSKAALLEARDINGNFVKVVTESGTVYLMGLVTQREATRASDIAARVPGTRRVVQAFEVITEDQAKAIDAALQGGKPAPEAQGGQSQDPGAAKVMPVR
ncbi:MAG: BON domain-containing protein, partial [Burkholderiaceae bacterium]